jgi:hypothetical protein
MATELENAEAIDFVENANMLSKEELIFEVESLHKAVFCGQPSMVDKKLYFSCQARLFKEFNEGGNLYKDYSEHGLNPFRVGAATVTPMVQNGIISNRRSDKPKTIELKPKYQVLDRENKIAHEGTEAECMMYWARGNKIIGFSMFIVKKVEGEYITSSDSFKLPQNSDDLRNGTSSSQSTALVPVKKKEVKDEIKEVLDLYLQTEIVA